VTVPLGNTSQSFEVDTTATASPVTATVTASWAGVTDRASLSIGGLALSFGGVSTVLGGTPAVLTITLAAPAPDSGATIALTSSNGVAQVPSTVVVPSGVATQTVPISTLTPAATTAVLITASYGGSSSSALLTVDAHPTITGVSCSPASPNGGADTNCTGTLSAPAPVGGWVLLFGIDQPAVATVPSSVTVGAGSATFPFKVSTAAVTASTTVAIQIYDAASGASVWRELLTIQP